MKFKYINLFIVLIILSACQNIDDKLKFRIDSLYEHTILMGEYSTNEQLEAIGLDMSFIMSSGKLTSEEKILQMNKAFSIAPAGNYETQVKKLEEKMNLMMEEWAKLQKDS